MVKYFKMHSIRTKITLLTVIVVIATLVIATGIGVFSIRKLGKSDADEMLHLTCATGAMNLERYFESVENSVQTVTTLVHDSFDGMPFEDLDEQVESTRNLFGRIANNTNGVLTYYFRIDPEISEDVKGFWYVNQDGSGFKEHEVTDITEYDTNDTSSLVWFTVPKATGEGVWLPPYYTENLDERVISYNAPVYWDNKFIGVIGIEIDYDTLADEVGTIGIYDSGYAFLLDENSNVIYHPQIDSEKLELETTALEDSDRYKGSNHVQYTFEGVKKEAVWMPLSNGMRLYVTAPESEIDRSWKSMIWELLIAALIILAIASIVMLRFMGGITKPLRELAEAAKQADRGNYDFELNYSGDDEVGTLTHTFKLLTAHTKDKLSAAREKANVDALTGVKNKNAYEQRKAVIDTKIKNGEQEPFALVVCDINNLKAVNDLYGHREGDTCIKNACAKICGIFSHSPVFRIGGDEFVAILSGEDYFRRKKLMEQISAVPRDRSKIRNGETIAAGMSEYNEEHNPSFTIMFEEADKAMYERKQFLKSMILPTESESDSESAYEYIPVIHARKQILIVDDMELTREMLGDLLQDDYDILYASDGVEAMDVLRSHKEDIDLVLLDLQMPNKSGREVIAEMQVDEDLMSIPVIFLTVDQDAELDCLKSGAMDFIPKPFPDIEIVKARIDKCIELSEDRDLIRYTERDKLTGLLNKDYFFRYVSRLDHLYKDIEMDAVVCDINHFHSINKQYGQQFGDSVLRNIGTCLRKLARRTGGIVCRQEGDTFLLYCPHQEDYEKLIGDFLTDLDSEKVITDKVGLRFGVFIDARQEPDVEERFVRAKIAADRVIDDKQKKCGYYDI